MKNSTELDYRKINLDDYESVFDAIHDIHYNESKKKLSMLDVLTFPVYDENDLKVKDLKNHPDTLKDGDFIDLRINSKYTDVYKIYLRIYKKDDLVSYLLVSDDFKIPLSDKIIHTMDIENPDIEYYDLFIKVLYSVKCCTSDR